MCCVCSVWLLENLETVRGNVGFVSHALLLPPSQRLRIAHFVASYCPFTAGILKRSTTFGKTAVTKQFCSLAYDLRCMAGHVCWLCSTAGTDHCCQLLCCKKQGDWESCWHCSLSTVIRGCFCCCREENAKGARSHFLALLLNLYKPYLNANLYFASIKKSGVLLF